MELVVRGFLALREVTSDSESDSGWRFEGMMVVGDCGCGEEMVVDFNLVRGSRGKGDSI